MEKEGWRRISTFPQCVHNEPAQKMNMQERERERCWAVAAVVVTVDAAVEHYSRCYNKAFAAVCCFRPPLSRGHPLRRNALSTYITWPYSVAVYLHQTLIAKKRRRRRERAQHFNKANLIDLVWGLEAGRGGLAQQPLSTSSKFGRLLLFNVVCIL